MQDTGWTDWLPSGVGLLGYRTQREAADAIGTVLEDPVRHGRAARRIAEEHFDARVVCAQLLAAL